MKKINLNEVKIYLSLDKIDSMIIDSQKDIANLVYMNTQGIEAHALAYKLFNAEGEIELSEGEWSIFESVINMFCKPPFIDAINEQINNN